MTAQQVRDFYEDKKHKACPLTNRLIMSGYQQRGDGYIAYASEYSAAHPDDRIEVDYKRAMPSQWWHLIRSWCDRSAPNQTFGRSIKCGELYYWMAEVSGVFTEDELLELADRALKIAAENTTDGKKPFKTAASNIYIRDYCFERIQKAVESYRK